MCYQHSFMYLVATDVSLSTTLTFLAPYILYSKQKPPERKAFIYNNFKTLVT